MVKAQLIKVDLEGDAAVSIYHLEPGLIGDGRRPDDPYDKLCVVQLVGAKQFTAVMPYDDSSGKPSIDECWQNRWLSVRAVLSVEEALARVDVEVVPGLWVPPTAELEPVTLVYRREMPLGELIFYRRADGSGLAVATLLDSVFVVAVSELGKRWIREAVDTAKTPHVLATGPDVKTALEEAGFFVANVDLWLELPD